MSNKPIFFDESGRRAARIRVVAWAVSLSALLILVGFATSLALSPRVNGLDFPGRVAIANPAQLEKRAQKPGLLARAERLALAARKRRLEDIARLHRAQSALPNRMLPAILKPQVGRPLAIGFYAPWGGADDTSWSSLKRSLKYLDWVVPNWMELNGPDMDFSAQIDQRALGFIRTNKPGVAILPMIQNFSGGKFDGLALARLLADRGRTDELLDQIIAFVAANKLQGVTIDFEDVPKGAHKDLEDFLSRMSAAFAPHDWIIAQAAPFEDDDWPYQTYANIVDYTMLMAYDQVDDQGPPGSIAGEDWYEKTLDQRMRQLPADSTIVVVGSWAYDWPQNKPAAVVSFERAMGMARDDSATVLFDPASNNPHFNYEEDDGTKHQVWFLDGVTAFNQIHAADPYRPAGYALWRLGSEDPSILPLMGRSYDAPAPDSLKHIPNDIEDPDYDGFGEILRIEAGPSVGVRTLTIEASTGDIVDERYDSLPTSYVIRKVGAVPGKLAITFDDGPDPEWTPAILDILKQKKVAATFFMIGSNMEAHPGLVQRVLAEGHEVGNHTYTHPNLADTPPAAVRLELNATQRLFQALTGRSMRFFRSPYLTDANPSDADELEPIEQAQELGYIEVTANLDTLDWEQLPVNQMMTLVFKALTNPNPDLRGNVVLMHDSGGDRSRTLVLLPRLIDALRAKGYTFVPLSELGGFKRDDVMPRLPFTISLYADRAVFLTISYVAQFLYYCFLGAIVLGLARLFVLAGLALWKRMKGSGVPIPGDGKPQAVTVLIPAFNEEKVIVTTIERILASDYPNMEVLVIDDGSKDHTAYIVRSHFMREPRVGAISIPNGGKANALNVGLANARGEVVVALDADTQFESTTISRLVRWFTDPAIGAVAGNAKVGNRINMITRWQALEYIVAQNLERRALSALDTLTVVPGAVGAWRRDVLRALGGFPSDTLAEDQDLTIAIQTEGYRVQFDPDAVAWTEAPATVSGLAKQRFRWAYGTLQCLWKYRGITFNPEYGELGLVALPQVWLFQILLTTLAPVADLLLVWQLVAEYINYAQHVGTYTGDNLRIVGLYYIVFILVDLLAAMVGFVMEKGEDWRLLLWLPLQRFGYRQIMYYVVVRSLWTALRGPFVGWGKLERHGTVKARA
ncbi:MAG TPA: glycosyltransferase [Rhizomicrobium sp.]|jgi:cellulose synthase/poly-beta-1,6-N-acetylglucosamine synthase-like glycosyltransferase/peptidoglycan/xylan/chitin deacetylase (PgdA/CDA1 family)|nr:glycosyltransferase [Rhizomicrobium sp.]